MVIAIASQITGVPIVYSTICSGANQRKHQSSASLAFVRRIHRWPVNYPHKWPITWKRFHLMTSSWICGHMYSTCFCQCPQLVHGLIKRRNPAYFGWTRIFPHTIKQMHLTPHKSLKNIWVTQTFPIYAQKTNFLQPLLVMYASVNKLPLVQVTACRVIGAKPWSEPMADYC